MKNVKGLLVAALALLSLTSTANIISPIMPLPEESPMRISLGARTSVINNSQGAGLNSIGGGLGLTHNAGYDFQWGLAAAYDWAGLGMPAGKSPPEKSRIFVENEGKNAAHRVAAELSLSFMPEVAEMLHVGGLFGFGWAGHFGERASEVGKSLGIARFGELNLRVNLALSYCFTDTFGFAFAPGYTLTGIRFAASDASEKQKTDLKEKYSNFSGVEFPLEFYLAASDNVGLYLNVNTEFTDVRYFKDSWKETFTLGLAFNM